MSKTAIQLKEQVFTSTKHADMIRGRKTTPQTEHEDTHLRATRSIRTPAYDQLKRHSYKEPASITTVVRR